MEILSELEKRLGKMTVKEVLFIYNGVTGSTEFTDLTSDPSISLKEKGDICFCKDKKNHTQYSYKETG